MIILFLVSLVCLEYILSTSHSSTVIGSTGVLGTELIRSLALRNDKNSRIYGSYRDRNKVKIIRNAQIRPQYFQLDLKNYISNLELTIKYGDNDRADSKHMYEVPPGFGSCARSPYKQLINAAGVCLPGSSLSKMKNSININALAPLTISIVTIQEHIKQHYRNKNVDRLTIMNVSSGDGELCYLHPTIANDLRNVKNLSELFDYIHDTINNYDSTLEYAFGDTPMYSLSKAFLNKGTELLHNEIAPKHQDNIRVIAVCPGNFESPMSTQEEKLSQTPIDKVVDKIIELGFNFDNYPSGKFYRNCEVISW